MASFNRMKRKWVSSLFFFVALLAGQSGSHFRFDSFTEPIILDQATSIVKSTARLIGYSPFVKSNDNERFIFQLYGNYRSSNKSLSLSIPGIYSSLKVSNNLSLSFKMAGFLSNEDLPQIVGAGFHLNLDKNNVWHFSVDRSQITGLRDFKQITTTLLMDRDIKYKKLEGFIGFGVNTYKSNILNFTDELPSHLNGEMNFILYGVSIPMIGIRLGLSGRKYVSGSTIHFSLSKGFK